MTTRDPLQYDIYNIYFLLIRSQGIDEDEDESNAEEKYSEDEDEPEAEIAEIKDTTELEAVAICGPSKALLMLRGGRRRGGSRRGRGMQFLKCGESFYDPHTEKCCRVGRRFFIVLIGQPCPLQ